MRLEFSDKAKKTIDKIIARYPQKEAALLPVLHVIQKEFGQISAEEEILAASLLGISQVKVREVVTFYTMFNRIAMGKYHIQVCSNLTCSLMGAAHILNFIEEKLGIKPGETTSDKKFTLSTVECLGACEHAPSMMVNFDYHGHLDKEKIDEILDNLE